MGLVFFRSLQTNHPFAMKQVLLFFCCIILACNKKQGKKPDIINGDELLSLVDGGYLKDYENLVIKKGWRIPDSIGFSSISGIETVDYKSEDTSGLKIGLNAGVTKDLAVVFLRFSTKSKKIFQKLKKQFIEAGFKSYKKVKDIEGFRKVNSLIHIIMIAAEEHYDVYMGEEKTMNF